MESRRISVRCYQASIPEEGRGVVVLVRFTSRPGGAQKGTRESALTGLDGVEWKMTEESTKIVRW